MQPTATNGISGLVVLVTSLALMAGCAMPSADSSAANSGASGQTTLNGRPVLRKGMSKDEVRVALGEPELITPTGAPPGIAEIWTYRFSVVKARQVQTSQITIPRDARGARVMGTLVEPVYSTEQRTVEQTIDLLMIDGHFIEWRGTQSSGYTLD